MARYIDVDKFKEWTKTDHECCKTIDCRSVHYDCTDCYYKYGGAEDVTPVVHAEWERNTADFGKYDYNNFECSNCNYVFGSKEYAYCPMCGAKMDEE